MVDIPSWLNQIGWRFKPTPEQQESGQQNVRSGWVAPHNDEAAFVVGDAAWGSFSYNLNFDQSFINEFELIKKYREVSLHPEVDRAVNEIVNEAIDGTTKSAPVEINLDNLDVSDGIKKKIQDEHKKICQLLDFNNESYEIFRKWYVDGKIHYQVVIDTNAPNEGIQELRYISPLNIKKIREEKTELRNGITVVVSYEDYFIYSRNMKQLGATANSAIGQIGAGAIKLTSDSVAYCSSGIIEDEKNVTYSYLQKAVRPTNQLRMIEDAVIIYRVSRAPERRVFYVDVGNMPAKKAEEALKNIMNRYKNTVVYDAVTGEAKDNKNTLSMMQDFWMPRRNGEKSTEIVTLPGGQNLGEIQDIDYFKKKVFESLNVPLGRLMTDQSPGFSIGKSAEITREEVGFAAFIERLRKRFSGLFIELLKKQLIMKKIISPDDWDMISQNISYDFASNTYFAEMKEMEILRERLATVQLMDPQPVVGTYYSRKWIMKNVLKLTDDDIKEMQDDIDDEGSRPQEEGAGDLLGPDGQPQDGGDPNEAGPPQDPTNLIAGPEETQDQDKQQLAMQKQVGQAKPQQPQPKAKSPFGNKKLPKS